MLEIKVLEEFNPVRLIVEVDDILESPGLCSSFNHNSYERAKHHNALKGIGPNNCLESSLKRYIFLHFYC